MKLEIDVAAEDHDRYKEIFQALIKSGGLTGVKSGHTSLHFDHQGSLQSVRLDYAPWLRRK